MGTYVNPGNDGFVGILRDRYVDKTGLIGLVNKVLGTPRKAVLVSRPRRFGHLGSLPKWPVAGIAVVSRRIRILVPIRGGRPPVIWDLEGCRNRSSQLERRLFFMCACCYSPKSSAIQRACMFVPADKLSCIERECPYATTPSIMVSYLNECS